MIRKLFVVRFAAQQEYVDPWLEGYEHRLARSATEVKTDMIFGDRRLALWVAGSRAQIYDKGRITHENCSSRGNPQVHQIANGGTAR